MITTDRACIARGRSYALKTSALDRALVVGGLDVDVQLKYWTPQSGGSVLEAFYWMPNQHVAHRRVYIRAGSVPSSERLAVVKLLDKEGLPAFIKWLSIVHGAPDDSTILCREPRFSAEFVDGRLTVAAYPAA